MVEKDNSEIPADAGTSGVQELETKHELVKQVPERLDSLHHGDGIGEAVSGLAELDPKYLGGPPGQVLLLGWMQDISAELKALRSENRKLIQQLTDQRIENARLRQELRQTKSEKNLRGLVITVGSVLLSAPLGFYSVEPILAGLVSACGLALLVFGWGFLPDHIRTDSE